VLTGITKQQLKKNVNTWKHENTITLERICQRFKEAVRTKKGTANNFIECFGPDNDICFSSPIHLKKSIIQLLLQLGLDKKMSSVQYIDDEALSDLGGGSNVEEKITRLKGLFREMKRYPLSMIIFDVDALCPSTKQFSSLKSELTSTRVEVLMENPGDIGGASFQYNVRNPELLDEIVNKAKNVIMSNSPTNTCWVVFLVSDKHLVSTLKDKLNWPHSPQEILEEKERKIQNSQRTCQVCGSIFTRATNGEGSCSYHLGSIVYQRPNGPPVELTFQDAIAAISLVPPRYDPSLIKWSCCSQGLQSKGEIPCPHREEEDWFTYLRTKRRY